MKKTHIVLDLTYHEDEGQQCFAGTHQECLDFISEQDTIGLQVVPMLKEKLELYNRVDLVTKVN